MVMIVNEGHSRTMNKMHWCCTSRVVSVACSNRLTITVTSLFDIKGGNYVVIHWFIS